MSEGSAQLEFNLSDDFRLNVYKGCVLPEDYKPVQTTTWLEWTQSNPGDYSPDQLGLIKTRMIAGKSWVCLGEASLTTISAPEHYRPTPQRPNLIRPKEKLV